MEKMSPTIHHKYKYFHSTVQRAKDRRPKFYFLPFAVWRNVELNREIKIEVFQHIPRTAKVKKSRDQVLLSGLRFEVIVTKAVFR